MQAVTKEVCNALIKKKKWDPMLCALCIHTAKKSAETCSNWQAMLNAPDIEKDFDERREFAKMPGDFEEVDFT